MFASSVAAAGSWLRKASGFFPPTKMVVGGNLCTAPGIFNGWNPPKDGGLFGSCSNPPKKKGQNWSIHQLFSGDMFFFQGDMNILNPTRRWFASCFFMIFPSIHWGTFLDSKKCWISRVEWTTETWRIIPGLACRIKPIWTNTYPTSQASWWFWTTSFEKYARQIGSSLQVGVKMK